jgi:glycosyltransferase involved in cell wall biosynthesis
MQKMNTIDSRRLRVLICAHEFSPTQGSECAVGWHIATRLAAEHDVTVLCATGSQSAPWCYREAVTAHLRRNGPIAGLRLLFVPQPRISIWLSMLNRFLTGTSDGVGLRILFYLALRRWHSAAKCAARNDGLDKYDLIHHLTPIAYWAAGTLYKNSALPYVWGPTGGFDLTPRCFSAWLGRKQQIGDAMRSLFQWLHMNSSSNLKRAVKRASIIWSIGSAESAWRKLRSERPPIPMLETASPIDLNGRAHSYDGARPLFVCWSGTHVGLKALPILLKALEALEDHKRVRVMILGEGPETTKWKELASQSCAQDAVEWVGVLPHQLALEKMRECDILVHTSVREGTPHVVLEALALGLPVVCHDAFGMRATVDESCGIKVPFRSPEESVSGFRDAIQRFLSSPALVEQLSRGALAHAAELSWHRKAKIIADAYRDVVGRDSQ